LWDLLSYNQTKEKYCVQQFSSFKVLTPPAAVRRSASGVTMDKAITGTRPEFFHGTTLNALLELARTDRKLLSSDKLIELGMPILSGEVTMGSGLQVGDFVSTTTSFETALNYAQPVSDGFNVQKVRANLAEAEANLKQILSKGYRDVATQVAEKRVGQLQHLLNMLTNMTFEEEKRLRENNIPIVIGISERSAPQNYRRDLLPIREVRIPKAVNLNDMTEIYVPHEQYMEKVKKILADLGATHIQVRLVMIT